MSTTATTKHRHQSALPNRTDVDISKDKWNDSLVVDGGATGALFVRDAAKADGYGLIDAGAIEKVLVSKGAGVEPEWSDSAVFGGSLTIRVGLSFGSTPGLVTLSADRNNCLDDSSQVLAAAIMRITSDAARNLTGIVPVTPATWQTLRIVNAGNYTITIKHNSPSSSAANRVSTPGGLDMPILSGCFTDIVYDPSSGVWRARTP